MNIIRTPFVVENGCAIYCPDNYFNDLSVSGEKINGYDRLVLGKKYDDIKNIIVEISKRYKHKIKGFHNSSESEISKLTELKGFKLKGVQSR